MYLKRLYKQNKFWFLFVVLFAFGQLFINYKNGLEISPLYHYGMFSLPFHFTPTYECVEVSVNGKPLQTRNFTPNEWDNILIPVVQYSHQEKWNSEMYNQTISRLLYLHDSSNYISQLSHREFDAWYHNRILRLLNITDSATDVQYHIVSYKLNNGILVK